MVENSIEAEEGLAHLSVDKYVIESGKTGFAIYADVGGGSREWIATAGDPKTATDIVEGLILVEMKRFYYPESQPTFSSEDGRPLPPFLRK